MGTRNEHKRRRIAPALVLILLAILLVAMAVSASVLTANATALPSFDTAVGGIGPCESCHPMASVHPTATHHTGFDCTTCHVDGNTGNPPLPSACAACHKPVATVVSTGTHATTGCGTTNGCHGFSNAAPTVSSFAPISGPVGATVTLTGTGFTGATGVTFNGVAATTFAVVSATQMTAKVPAGATSGGIVVTTPNGPGTSATSFTVSVPAKPSITKLSPTAGKRGVTVTITGKAFGTKRGTSFVKFGTVKVSKYISWSAAKIKVRVPAKAKFGSVKVMVTTAAGNSRTKAFTVKR